MCIRDSLIGRIDTHGMWIKGLWPKEFNGRKVNERRIDRQRNVSRSACFDLCVHLVFHLVGPYARFAGPAVMKQVWLEYAQHFGRWVVRALAQTVCAEVDAFVTTAAYFNTSIKEPCARLPVRIKVAANV